MEISPRQKELLESQAVAVATINADGSPNLIAVADVRVVSPTEILITDNFMHTTPKNITRDPRICCAVWSSDRNEGWKITGTATYHESGTWVSYVKAMDENKGYPAKGAILVSVTGIYKLG